MASASSPPPSAPPPSNYTQRATVIAEEFINQLEEPFSAFKRTERFETARKGAYIVDIEQSFRRFRLLWHVFWNQFPVLNLDDEIVPLDVTDLIVASMRGFPRGVFRPEEENVSLIEHGSALDLFRNGLIEYTSVRLEAEHTDETPDGGTSSVPSAPQDSSSGGATATTAGAMNADVAHALSAAVSVKARARSLGAAVAATSSSANPYMPFTVYCRTYGLDVEESPAYFLSWTFFGAPSWPIDGWLLPGLHRFRGRDTNGNYTYDSMKFRVGSGYTVASTNL